MSFSANERLRASSDLFFSDISLCTPHILVKLPLSITPEIFTTKNFEYEKGVRLYFLTDGFCDQSGGNENKRFTSYQFELLLSEIQDLEMSEQKQKLDRTFENWKGSARQRDDVLVIGVKC